MQANSSENCFDVLIGEKLSSVTFVMDYLQIDFDGNRFTFNIWPLITVDNVGYKFGDALYRDMLCSLIARIVSKVTLVENEKIVIEFGSKDNLYLLLDANEKEIINPEIAHFTDAKGRWYFF